MKTTIEYRVFGQTNGSSPFHLATLGNPPSRNFFDEKAGWLPKDAIKVTKVTITYEDVPLADVPFVVDIEDLD